MAWSEFSMGGISTNNNGIVSGQEVQRQILRAWLYGWISWPLIRSHQGWPYVSTRKGETMDLVDSR